MSIICLISGLEVNYPCSPVCQLFGDCLSIFEAQKKGKVVTNADRIRSMSDEELATFLYSVSRSCADHNCAACPIGVESCSVLLHWLRKEYI